MAGPSGIDRRGREVPTRLKSIPAWATGALLAAIYLLVEPHTGDHAAQLYRVGLFERQGLAIYDTGWYGGVNLLSYSVLFPPLGALIGARLAGALAVVAATALFERLTDDRLAAHWFALGASTLLITGRLTFALGVAFGTGALVAMRFRRPGLAATLAIMTGLASPVAAIFLALCAGAVLVTDTSRRDAGVILGAALLPVVLLNAAFPQGGSFPFDPTSFWPQFVFVSVIVAYFARNRLTLLGHHPLFAGFALYGLLLVACFALPSAIGGNAARLGALAAGPALVVLLRPDARRWLLPLAALPALYWQLSAPVENYAQSVGDNSVHASYYSELEQQLRQRRPGRIEIPFTENHWEVAYIAPLYPLARGWLRQVDRDVNGLFYKPGLAAGTYRRWLQAKAVTHVAVPDAPLDYSARDEVRVIARGVPGLRRVWTGRHWTLYEVRRPRAQASDARVLDAKSDGMTVDASHRGYVPVALRWSPYWYVASGNACVAPDDDDTQLRVLRPGRIVLKTKFSLDRVGARSERCS